MAKFFRLVQNEYIKILKKASTIVLLVLVFIFSVGHIGLAKIADFSINTMMDDFYGSTEDYRVWDLEYCKEQLAAAQTEEERAEIQNAIDLLEFQMEHCEEDGGHWTNDAASMLFGGKLDTALSADAETDRTRLRQAIIDRDSRTYLEISLKYDKLAMQQMGYSKEEIETALLLDQTLYDYNLVPDNETEEYQLIEKWALAKSELDTLEAMVETNQSVSSESLQKAKDEFLLLDYRVQNKIYYDVSEHSSWMMTGQFDFWSVFNGSATLSGIIGTLIIVIAGGIVASEFSQGTIKFLLINPVKRWKILVAKYITAISFGYILLLLTFIISGVLSAIVMGFDVIDASYYYVSNHTVKHLPGLVYTLRTYMFSSVSILVNATLAFAISSMVRSTALAVGVGIGATFLGNTISGVLAMLQLDWGRFLIFTNTDLQSIVTGNTLYTGQTLGFSIAIIAIHMFVFLLMAWDGFIRREV